MKSAAPYIAIAAALSAVTMAAGQGQTTPQATFRSSAVAVPVEVSVRDKTRKAVVGLTAKDFIVSDNGIAQEVSEVSYGTRPIDVTVGLDVSASVTGEVLDALRRAVLLLMGDLRKDDRLKLLLFNSEVRRAVDFTTDVKAVENAMRRVPAGGGTALHDTLSVAMVGASEPDRRQLVMFFTDGIDSGSAVSTALLETVAQRTRATLTFVVSRTGAMSVFGMSGLVGNTIPLPTGQGSNFGAGRGMGAAPTLFGRLAAETGGTVLFSDGSATLGSTFRKILDEFRSTYVLFYSPKGVERPGFHTITVEVARPDVIVQARRGYFGG